MSSARPREVHGTGLGALRDAVPGLRPDLGTAPDGPDVLVTGVTLDSRAVRPGDLYAALPGFTTHGAAFAGAARDAGAVAVLTDDAGLARLRADGVRLPALVADDPRAVLGGLAAVVHGHPAQALTLVGVTGTNGKTTTAYLIESGLRHLGLATGLIGTVETRVGATRLPSARTTPEAPDLHALFALMREEGVAAAVMEVSSHALAQHRVDGAVFDVALFTNLSQDHLDFHPSMEDYFQAKALLFTPEHSRRGVVCVDGEWGRRLAAQAGVPVTTLATRDGVEADWRVRDAAWPDLVLEGPASGGRPVVLHLHCHLPGDFNVANTAMAALALLQLGHAPADVERALGEEPVVPGRMEVVTAGAPRGDDPRGIVDYAHTPDAVEAALRAIRPTTAGPLVVVLGAGGDRDTGKRPAMGAAAARHADVVVVTDDNPRSEDPAAIRAEVERGARDARDGTGAPDPLVLEVAGRAAAVERAVALARERAAASAPGTVLVLGKGHETGQEVAGTRHPFDDRDALRAALDGTAYRPEDPA
ncbi:UDP-N-acetylmuramoyl-L-alanyl-D-glutamate--2,6-diaminopimelate ligase [Lapillicoccus jejuensis]|nr:UDP-N-acetylmuramoyl-L-alanyl-D-glutamate--2,6-diaminopimelate ligase [Lapillicoccus jejuensis]